MEPTCRICFEGEVEGEEVMIEPCACSGTQAKVHPRCLKQWQAHLLLEAASSRGRREAGARDASTCPVCKTQFNAAPPQTEELLSLVSSRGAEIATAIRGGTLLVAAPRDPPPLDGLPPWLCSMIHNRQMHWHCAVYLITHVEGGGGADGSDAVVGVNPPT